MNASRSLHQTTSRAYPRKDSQDKDSINTEPTEYSKSGSDSAAAQEKEAFDPSTTRPEEEKSGGDSEVSWYTGHNKSIADTALQPSGSLNASPANTNLGKSASKKDDSGASPSESSSSQGSRARSSGGGSPDKGAPGPGKA